MRLVRITRILQKGIKYKILVREPQGTDYFEDLLFRWGDTIKTDATLWCEGMGWIGLYYDIV